MRTLWARINDVWLRLGSVVGRSIGGCERCGALSDVKAESFRIVYFDHPDAEVFLCRRCAEEHHAYCDEVLKKAGRRPDHQSDHDRRA